jgi:hypothetical protein
VTYAREQVYPSIADSRRLSSGILRLAVLNPPFARMLGLIYVVLGVAMLGNSGPGALVAKATRHGLGGFLAGAAGAVTIILAGLLLGAIHAGTEIVPRRLEPRRAIIQATRAARASVALLHTALHLAIAALVLWAVLRLAGDRPLVIWAAGLAGLFVAGTALGATLFGGFLLAIHRARGADAWETANRVFAGQAIADYKNLLRMRFAADGTLTIHPLGVERAVRDWCYDGADGARPRFGPGGAPPAVQPIDVPLHYDATGRRVR